MLSPSWAYIAYFVLILPPCWAYVVPMLAYVGSMWPHVEPSWELCWCQVWAIYVETILRCQFFPRASERRVLPIVGVCKTSSHPHIFSSSPLLIFTFSLHSRSSSHIIFSSSHLLIITSAHLHIFSSSHLLIFISSHPYIFSSCPLALLPSPSFLFLIFTSAHLHIFTSSHFHILTSLHFLLLPSCPLLLFYFSLEGGGQGQCQRDGTKRNPFARNEVRSPKTEVKLRFASRPAQPFRTK